jgi:hypothetical protein
MQQRSVTQQRTVRTALFSLFVAGVLAGCGGGESVSNGAPGASAPPPPAGAPAPGGSTNPTGSSCTSAPTLFTSTVWPSMRVACAACHITNGVASGTQMVFVPGSDDLRNYNILRTYALGNSATLLSKSIGINHTGGSPYGNSSSTEYGNLQALIPIMSQPCASTPAEQPVAGQFWQGVSFKDNAKILASAAVQFAGRNPTASEYAAVATGGMTALRQTMRGYMQGPVFEAFLDEIGDTHFLAPGVVVFGNNMGYSATDFPMSADLINNANGFPGAVRNRFQNSARREAVELMKFIVKNDIDYRDMVRGNYTVMNGVMATNLMASVDGAFVNADDDNEWRRAIMPSQRLGGNREHAGVLSTHPWLQRFPTTDTNRNRHRVYILFKQFLGTDVTALAVRPLDDGTSFRVPTIENPACAVCHDVIDPVAAGFQNWNEANRFLPFRTAAGKDHALPTTYRANNYPRDANNARYYQDGDNWFRDGKEPGYGATPMPGGYAGNPNALQWLGTQVANDPRFALGAVHFWYEGIFGREPLKAPFDTTAPGYANKLSAYNEQNAEFQQIAQRFASGGFKVRDLLVDLMTSNWYRAERGANLTPGRMIELHDIGSANMLTPRALNAKLIGLVGLGWNEFDNPYTGWGLDYGNFNGIDRISRAKEHTMMQTIGIDRLIAVRSCTFAQNDFNKPVADRLLFPNVVLADTPATEAGRAAIMQNIQHLHKWLLKEDLAAGDPELLRTYQLYMDIWNDRATAAGRTVACSYNNNNDANYTGRAWAAVLGYMIGDAKFLFE